MADRHDIGGIVDSSQLGKSAIFLYDRYDGGAWQRIGEPMGLPTSPRYYWPARPQMEIDAAGASKSIIGTKNGLTRLGPRST